MAKDHKFHRTPTVSIAKLRSVLQDDYCRQHMNKSVVTGFLGELLLGEMLQKAGHEVEHYGGQHGLDLRVPRLGVAIDVKTSTLKTELDMQLWGWALQSGSKQKDITFTHVVCLALNEALELVRLFVVRVQDLEKFPEGVNPFKNNKRILLVPQDVTPTKDRSHLKTEQLAALELCAQRVREGVVGTADDVAELETHLRSTVVPKPRPTRGSGSYPL